MTAFDCKNGCFSSCFIFSQAFPTWLTKVAEASVFKPFSGILSYFGKRKRAVRKLLFLVRVTGLECYKLCFTIFHNIAINYISSRFQCIFIAIRFTLFQIGKEQIKNTNQAQSAPKKTAPDSISNWTSKNFGLDVLYHRNELY